MIVWTVVRGRLVSLFPTFFEWNYFVLYFVGRVTTSSKCSIIPFKSSFTDITTQNPVGVRNLILDFYLRVVNSSRSVEEHLTGIDKCSTNRKKRRP